METSSADGKRDLLVGLVFVTLLTVLGYYALMNVNFLLDNAFIIILIGFAIGLMFTAVPYIIDIVKNLFSDGNSKKSVDTDQEVSMDELEEDSTQSVDLEIREPPSQ